MRTRQKMIVCTVVMMTMLLSVWMESIPTQAAIASAPTTPFYGIWCEATKTESDAEKYAEKWKKMGFNALVVLTTDWSNLNTEAWYAVTVGTYSTLTDAQSALAKVKSLYSSAYVKYTGDYQGSIRVKITVTSYEDITPGKLSFLVAAKPENSKYKNLYTIDGNTVFDEKCDMKSFEHYRKGETVMEWYQKEYDLYLREKNKSHSSLKGVFDVQVTKGHIDRIYGTYWWD